jgi:hypothetical protein
MIDDADLIVTEAIHAIFAQEELGVLDEEVSDIGFAEVKDETTGVPFVEEVE